MGFKENFKAELSYSGMLVKEISALAGVNYRSLNNYLSKRGQIPSVETGVKIARALGVSAEFLVFGEDVAERAGGEVRAITGIARGLSENKRKFALDFLRLLNEREM